MASATRAVATRAFKAIDWEQVAKLVSSDAGKKELASLKRQYDDVSSYIDTKFSQKVVAIDWAMYKAKLGPGITDIFENSYKSLEIPDFVDTDTPEFQKTHALLVEEATKEEEVSRKEAARLKAEIADLQAQKESIKTLTVDEYFAKHPAVKEKIDDEIRNQNWGY